MVEHQNYSDKRKGIDMPKSNLATCLMVMSLNGANDEDKWTCLSASIEIIAKKLDIDIYEEYELSEKD